jgi:hypothetical protein
VWSAQGQVPSSVGPSGPTDLRLDIA